MKILWSLLLISTLTACSSGETVPDWKIDTQSAMQRYTQYYLEGRSKLADASFARARAATAATGDIAAVGHLELVKCGVQVAALNPAPCSAYSALAANDTPVTDAAYYRFLVGEWRVLDRNALPSQYTPLVDKSSASIDEVNQTIQGIHDPVSRLVATGVMVKRKQFNLRTLQIASETAAAQGWRRPLLAYLLLQKINITDPSQQQQIQTRIEIVESSLP